MTARPHLVPFITPTSSPSPNVSQEGGYAFMALADAHPNFQIAERASVRIAARETKELTPTFEVLQLHPTQQPQQNQSNQSKRKRSQSKTTNSEEGASPVTALRSTVSSASPESSASSVAAASFCGDDIEGDVRKAKKARGKAKASSTSGNSNNVATKRNPSKKRSGSEGSVARSKSTGTEMVYLSCVVSLAYRNFALSCILFFFLRPISDASQTGSSQKGKEKEEPVPTCK
ncbi:hypothetical protein DFH11DRAFT_1645201 [Phellopilus nigrolimitatus]|nr:hypothetical protein DFH11DRAFT_1645201 [Phellopilus nigrolimitatus]